MKTIWKYPFYVEGTVVIEMPKGAQILPYVAADAHSNLLVIWAEVDDNPDVPKEDKIIRVVGTGTEIPKVSPPNVLTYIGTVPNGPWVWHVYEQTFNQIMARNLWTLEDAAKEEREEK